MRRCQWRPMLALVLIVALVASASGFVAAQGAGAKSRWLIGFRSHPGNAEHALIQAFGGTELNSLGRIPVIAADLPAPAAAARARNPLVAYVEPNGAVYALEEQTPWGVTRVNAPQVWAGSQAGAGVLVAVLDTGVDTNHPDLAANIRGGRNVIPGATPANYADDNGHGTHVAGTVLAVQNNGLGVVGVAPEADLWAVKVLNSSGSGSWETVAAGINEAISAGAKVISMSLGGTGYSSTLETACNTAEAAGILVVAAAGNSGRANASGDTVEYPGKYASVIAVAATDINNVRPKWSSTGPAVELAAPGVGVLSTYPDDAYATASGTSMATPHVAGVAALLFKAFPAATNDDLRAALAATATDLGAADRDYLYGYGLVNVQAAYDLLAGVAPNQSPTCVITSPAPGQVAGVVTVTVDASDDHDAGDALSVTFSVNGLGEYPAAWNGTAHVAAWDTTGLTDGSYVLVATVRDQGGLTGVSPAVTVEVANGSSGTADWKQDLEAGTWTAAGNPAGKTAKKDYYFTPPAGLYTACAITIQGTGTGIGDVPLWITVNGHQLPVVTLGTTIGIVANVTPEWIIPGASNTLRLQTGLLYKGQSISITVVEVALIGSPAQ